MSDIAIRVNGVSKEYQLGERETYRTFRDLISRTVATPFRALRSKLNRSSISKNRNERIWALKDLTFEIKQGERVGVIGRNGAGKSTLLKLLSRITEPTEGYADVHGRVGSLLEVGTGFHQELSGRENIYLNGAIIGMKKSEIRRKFDDIVAFAEVERFIDTPVKHYSSGMYLRLAFSVAAHLEPEILLVDEVLAVGDVAFQRKCLGKMEEVAERGRTVLFVSHNLGAIRELCRTSIVLNQGHLDFRGPVVEGLAHYSRSLAEDGEAPRLRGRGWQGVQIDDYTEGIATSKSGEPFFTEATLNLANDFTVGRIFLIINDAVGGLVVHQRIDSSELGFARLPADRYRLRAELPVLWLAPGIYSLHYKFIGRTTAGKEERYSSERVMLDVSGDVTGTGRAVLAPPARWTFASETSTFAENSEPVCQTHC